LTGKAGLKTQHVFSIDVEDWYQSSFDYSADISDVCVNNTRRVLGVLAQYGVKGTFFMQGMVARKFPNLVREIDSLGHEVQSHGYSHRPVNSMTPAEFKAELTKTSRLIEDVTGKPVTGFRAPDFSIDSRTFWAFDVMRECGILYDSSVFPLRTRRYGVSGFEKGYSVINTPYGHVDELPVSVLELNWAGRLRLPVGGGGYFRLLPLWFLSYCLERLDTEELPFVIYCHPYEFNPEELRMILRRIPLTRRLHQGLGRGNFQKKVSHLLKTKAFGTMSSVLAELKTNRGKKECA